MKTMCRRRVAMAEDERMRKEADAFYAAHIRGRGRCPQEINFAITTINFSLLFNVQKGLEYRRLGRDS